MSKKNLTRYFSITLMVLFFSVTLFSTSAFAAEVKNNALNTETTINPINSTLNNNITLASTSYTEKYWGGFTFTNYNWGAYHTINGSNIRYLIAYRKSSIDPQSTSIGVYTAFYQYGGNLMYSMYCQPGQSSAYTDSEGYTYYYSNWFNVKSGVDYRIYYDAFTSGGPSQHYRSADVKVWIDIQ